MFLNNYIMFFFSIAMIKKTKLINLMGLRCPLPVSILLEQYCRTLALVRPGKLVNQPLSILASQLEIGGAPRHM